MKKNIIFLSVLALFAQVVTPPNCSGSPELA